MYDSESQKISFEEKFSGNYIKLKEVEQSPNGENFAVAFCDDGVFKLRIFGKETREPE